MAYVATEVLLAPLVCSAPIVGSRKRKTKCDGLIVSGDVGGQSRGQTVSHMAYTDQLAPQIPAVRILQASKNCRRMRGLCPSAGGPKSSCEESQDGIRS